MHPDSKAIQVLPQQLKIAPPTELCFCSSRQDVFFPGGASLLLDLCVLNSCLGNLGGPSSPGWGSLLLSLSKRGPMGAFPEPPSSLRAPPRPRPSDTPSSPSPALPTPHPPLGGPWAPDPTGPGTPWNVSCTLLHGTGAARLEFGPHGSRLQPQQSLPLAEGFPASIALWKLVDHNPKPQH